MVAALKPQEDEFNDDTFASHEEREQWRCAASPMYFIINYCLIYDPVEKDWIPFELWQPQKKALMLMHENQKVIVLKARQLGLSWLALAYALWQMLFQPVAAILIFSRRDDEAKYLLGHERLKGMYSQLPSYLKARYIERDNEKYFKLSNGSWVRAFPTTSGDSYTATMAIVDEADLIENFNDLMRAVKPTIENGGKFFLISRSNKDQPKSEFKKIYRGARAGRNEYVHIFLPWYSSPNRDEAWYQRLREEILERTGSDDELKEQYPATDDEALDAASRDKRVPPEWVNRVKDLRKPIPAAQLPPDAPKIDPDVFRVYVLPEKFKKYAGGADCAEGLPNSDDSVSQFIQIDTGEQVCTLSGKLTPAVHAAYTQEICRWYNNAKLMPENNNHGHAFIQWFTENGHTGLLLQGHTGKYGWTSSTIGKIIMYDQLAETCKEAETIIHDDETIEQIKSVEKSTLLAPKGENEDHADAWAMAVQAWLKALKTGGVPFRTGVAKR